MFRKCDAKQATGDALPQKYWSRTFANVSRIYFNVALAQEQFASFGYIIYSLYNVCAPWSNSYGHPYHIWNPYNLYPFLINDQSWFWDHGTYGPGFAVGYLVDTDELWGDQANIQNTLRVCIACIARQEGAEKMGRGQGLWSKAPLIPSENPRTWPRPIDFGMLKLLGSESGKACALGSTSDGKANKHEDMMLFDGDTTNIIMWEYSPANSRGNSTNKRQSSPSKFAGNFCCKNDSGGWFRNRIFAEVFIYQFPWT